MDKLTDAEIDECSQAAFAARELGRVLDDKTLVVWRSATQAVITGSSMWDHTIPERDAARSRAAAILAARKRERLGPWHKVSDSVHGRLLRKGWLGVTATGGYWMVWNSDQDKSCHAQASAPNLSAAMLAADAAARELYDLDDSVAHALTGATGDAATDSAGQPRRDAAASGMPAQSPAPVTAVGPEREANRANSSLAGLLCSDILRHQPIALQRAIVDCLQSSREVPSALLWRMELEREPEAAALRAEVIAGRMVARGWRKARE